MLTIIIPTLNEENYLPLLLKSIKRQSFKDYEIIIADANSTDKTVETAQDIDCQIVNGGLPPKGKNEGARVAKGEMLLFIDADSRILSDDFLEKILQEFKKRNLDIASFLIYPDENKLDKFIYTFYNIWAKLNQSFLPYATNVILVKKEIHQKIGGFDKEIKLAEDHEYARRAGKIGKFGFIDIEPILTSSRRFEKEGRVKTYFKYGLAGIYVLFFGSIKSDIFKYRFGNYLKNKKN
jgi:glycosyltransferase involved in cell wall biosynthesis